MSTTTMTCHMFQVGFTYTIEGPVSPTMDCEEGRKFTVKKRNDRSTVVSNPLAEKDGYISAGFIINPNPETGEDECHELLVLPKDIWGEDVRILAMPNGEWKRLMPRVKKSVSPKQSAQMRELEELKRELAALRESLR